MRAVLIVGAVLAALISGCAVGDDAVTHGGTFEFVSPGGKTDIFYDPRRTAAGPARSPGPT